jgi:hypothetical protein
MMMMMMTMMMMMMGVADTVEDGCEGLDVSSRDVSRDDSNYDEGAAHVLTSSLCLAPRFTAPL